MVISLKPTLTIVMFGFSLVTSLAASAKDFSETDKLAKPLLPEHVLASSLRHFPAIKEALELEEAASGDLLAAKGDFDLQLKADAYDRVNGFWTGGVVKTEARQYLANSGTQVYGTYRLSDGSLPVYEDINFTNTAGELKVGALFALLKDRTIDKRRFGVIDRKLASEQATLNVLLTRLEVQQKAINAYWRWLAAGRELEVYSDLLVIANQRRAGLEQQVKQGAKPGIELTENQQNIIRRKVFVVQAQRNVRVAANALSLYLRDSNSNIQQPELSQLPKINTLPSLKDTRVYSQASASSLLKQRPELRNLKVAIERAEYKVAISENNLKPSLGLNLELSRDFGNIAEGGSSRDSSDAIVGLVFSVPLQRRQAKGELVRAKAELNAIKLKSQRVQDKIEIEFNNILADLTNTLELADLAKQEVVQSQLMVNAERDKFRSGASDFFLVNLREERAADAEIRSIRAQLKGRIARSSYDAASINLSELGIANSEF